MEEIADMCVENACPEEQAADQKPKVTVRKKWVVMLCVALGIVILAGATFGVVSALSPERIAVKYYEALCYNDINELDTYLAYDYLEWVLDGRDEEDFFKKRSNEYHEKITSWGDYARVRREYAEKKLYREYGAYDLTVNALESRDITLLTLEDEYSDILRRAETEYDINIDDISAVKVVTIRFKIDGEEEGVKEIIDVIMVRSGILWKVLDWDLKSRLNF